MTTGHSEPAVDAELVTVLRNLSNAAIAARPFVEAVETYHEGILLDDLARRASEDLAALDAAIADAGEYLAGVSS